MIKKWRSYLLHPLIIGFVLSLVVIYFLASYLPHYHAEIIKESAFTNNGEVYYFDLDEDGNSEKIHYYHYDRIFKPTLYLYDSKDNFKSLWNFFESPVKNCKIFAGDYNNDRIKEIFVFTENEDSLFLYILNTQNDRKLFVDREFIAKISNPDSDLRIIPIGLYNLNKNEKKEFLFAIDAGYPVSPRKIFSFDISTRVLNSSPEINVKITDPILVEDLNFDGKPEIVISNESVDVVGNGSEAQLIVFNQDLEYSFQPIVYLGCASQITVSTVALSDSEKLISVLHSGTTPENVFNTLTLYNNQGKQVKEIDVEKKSNFRLSPLSPEKNKLFLFNGNEIYRYNVNLEKEKVYRINNGGRLDYIQSLDITGNSKSEVIFNNNENIIIASDDFKYKAKLHFPDSGDINISVVKCQQKTNQLSIQIGSNWYLCDFYKNEAFFYSQIFYLLIFILISFLTFLISKIRLKLICNKKYYRDIEKDLVHEIEDNIEENYTGLKTKILEISDDLESDSMNKIMVEIDETFKKLRPSHKNIENKSLPDNHFKERLSILIAQKKEQLNITLSLFPEDSIDDIQLEIKDFILEFVEHSLNFISNYAKNSKLVLQILKHNEYLNLSIEIENVYISAEKFDQNVKLAPIFEKVHAKLVIDNMSDFGTIMNVTIPFNFKGTIKENGTKKIRIIIAEDHDVSLFGLVSLFKTKDDIEVVGTAKNGMEVLKLLETINTDIVITDISMPGMDGIELSEKLKNEYPDIKVIVFTMYLENWFVEQLINNGAKGFVSKNSKIIELISAVRNVFEGNNYYCPQFKSKFGLKGSNNAISPKLDSLTKSELYIVKQYAENLSKEKIALKINVNNKTIDSFVANILLKLNAGNEEEIIQIAKKQKFVSQ